MLADRRSSRPHKCQRWIKRTRLDEHVRAAYAREVSYKNPKPRSALRPAFFLLFNCRFQIIVIPNMARAKSTNTNQPLCNVS